MEPRESFEIAKRSSRKQKHFSLSASKISIEFARIKSCLPISLRLNYSPEIFNEVTKEELKITKWVLQERLGIIQSCRKVIICEFIIGNFSEVFTVIILINIKWLKLFSDFEKGVFSQFCDRKFTDGTETSCKAVDEGRLATIIDRKIRKTSGNSFHLFDLFSRTKNSLHSHSIHSSVCQ